MKSCDFTENQETCYKFLLDLLKIMIILVFAHFCKGLIPAFCKCQLKVSKYLSHTLHIKTLWMLLKADSSQNSKTIQTFWSLGNKQKK